MHVSTLVAAAAVIACLAAPAALADPPVREPLPNEPFVIDQSCPFEVLLEPLRSKEVVTIFGNGKLLITGQLVVRLTNLTSGKTLDLNIPGSVVVTEDADAMTTIWLRGRNLVYLWPTDAGGPALFLTEGTAKLVNDANFNTVSVETTGRRTDLCAALS